MDDEAQIQLITQAMLAQIFIYSMRVITICEAMDKGDPTPCR